MPTAWLIIDAQTSEHVRLIKSAAAEVFDVTRVDECAPDGLPLLWYTQPAANYAHVFFITENQTTADADPIFALYTARIPVLCLRSLAGEFPVDSALLEYRQAGETVPDVIRRFFHVSPSAASPSVIVFEGGDGSGKQTQTALTANHLSNTGRTVRTLDFPHDSGLYGGLLRVFLSGQKGGLSALDPRIFSFIFTLNRYGSLPELSWWALHCDHVLLDRYYTANYGHQASKLPLAERDDFIARLERMEVRWLRLPRASTVFYLDLSTEAALEAMSRDTTRQYLDIHETAGSSYKNAVRDAYVHCCETLGWEHIYCCRGSGPEQQRKSREEVNAEIIDALKRTGVIPTSLSCC